MATLTASGINFSDGSALNSAAPANGAVGVVKFGIYFYTTSAPSGNNTFVGNMSNFSIGTSISGGSLASEFFSNSQATASQATGNAVFAYVTRPATNRVGVSFVSSGANWNTSSVGGSILFGGAFGITSSTNTSYSTNSGTWRSLNAHTNSVYYDTTYNTSNAAWYTNLWIRTA